MAFSSALIQFCFLIMMMKFAEGLERHDEKHADHMEHLKELPREFILKGDKVRTKFRKYVNDIETLTAGSNVTPVYLVRVELRKQQQKLKKKKLNKKIKTKKYNVPLKKENMKLSNFEVLLRKLAEENDQKLQNYDTFTAFTTTKPNKHVSFKPIQLKFKPILGQVRTNYTKVIKPVRNKVITLT